MSIQVNSTTLTNFEPNPEIKNISSQVSSAENLSAKASKEQMPGQQDQNSAKGEDLIIQAVQKAQKKVDTGEREFEFAIHEKTKDIMVKVLDKDSKEVIREIPSEKVLDMVAELCEKAGLFVDKKI